MKTLPGLTEQETQLLKLIAITTPWKRDKVSKSVGAYLDGETDEINGMPVLTEKFESLIEGMK